MKIAHAVEKVQEDSSEGLSENDIAEFISDSNSSIKDDKKVKEDSSE